MRSMNPLYFLILRLTQGVAQAFFKLKIINREKLIEDGACIYVMNHQSFLDPPMIGQLFASTKVHFLARKTLFDNPILGAILPYCNVIPIDQEQPDPGSILKVLRLVKNGGRIIIFPEGSRCVDNQIHDAMPGIGLILGRLQGVPIQPLRIDGAYDCLPIHSSKLRFKPITIAIGDPIEFTKDELKARGRAGQLAIGKKVMDAIRALPTTC